MYLLCSFYTYAFSQDCLYRYTKWTTFSRSQLVPPLLHAVSPRVEGGSDDFLFLSPRGPLTLAVNSGPRWETFQNWNSEVQRDVPARARRTLHLSKEIRQRAMYLRELNYPLWRRLLHSQSVKLLNTGIGKHSIC